MLHRSLDDLRLANLLHQVRYTALFDELRTDVFGKRGKLLQLRRIGEEACQEVEAFDVAGEQINECFALFRRCNL